MHVFVEGGGDRRELLTRCRKGFADLFARVLAGRRLPKVIACGSRSHAFRDFCDALERPRGAFCILLVDSEGPVRDGAGAWQHLRERAEDGWVRPPGAGDDQAHLMVQCMETWLLADHAALARFYGQGFRESALPVSASERGAIERIPKRDVLRALDAATRDARTKGVYSKGEHSYVMLGLIDAERVGRASPFAARLFDTLRRAADETR